jgi:hypothetical protein
LGMARHTSLELASQKLFSLQYNTMARSLPSSHTLNGQAVLWRKSWLWQ